MRFSQIDYEAMSVAQKDVYDQLAQGPRAGVRGPFLALLHHPDLAQRVQALGEHLRYRASVDQSLIELVILTTAKHWDCAYEWFAHSRIAHTTTDLGEQTIEDIRLGQVPQSATQAERLAYDLATSLHQKGRLSDELFAACRDAFGLDGVLDLICTCGYYTTIAMVLNVAQSELPEDAPLKYQLYQEKTNG